jgi:hypothetical protein
MGYEKIFFGGRGGGLTSKNVLVTKISVILPFFQKTKLAVFDGVAKSYTKTF